MGKSARRPFAVVLALGGALVLAACELLVSTDGLTGVPIEPVPVGDEASTSATDASDAGHDAAFEAGPPCDPGAIFGTPVLVDGLESPQDTVRAQFSPDELTVYFSRTINNGRYQIFSAHRAALTSRFDTPAALPGLTSAFSDDGPTLTADGLWMYFASSRLSNDAGQQDLFVTNRKANTDDFSAVNVAVNTGATEQHPYVRADGTDLWFVSDLDGGTDAGASGRDIFRAVRHPDGTLETGIRVTELASPTNEEASPVISNDGLLLFFGSDRIGTFGGRDVFVASRATTAAPFGTATDVSPVNSTHDDTPSWLSPDACRLYVTSSRLDGGTVRQIFVASRRR